MDRRAPVAVAALALLLAVSTAGCVEVRDKPESGPFTIRLEMPPMLFVNDIWDKLNGSLAQVETELENRTPSYSWDVDGDGIADLNGSTVAYHTFSGIRVAHYIVTYYGQQRGIPLFLAGSGRAVVADALFLENASWASTGTRTPLSIHEGNGLYKDGDFPEGVVFRGVRGHLTDPLGINISLPSNASGPSTYVAAFVLNAGERPDATTGVFRIWPGEQHHIGFENGSSLLLNITSHSGTTVVYSGPAEDAPANRTAKLGVLVWTGRVGEEPAPGPGPLAAAVALVCVTVALARRRSSRLATRRAS